MKRLFALLIATSIVVPASAFAGQLQIKEISSNSVLTDAEKGIVYGPENMVDGLVTTMWVEGEGSAGLGKYIEVKFDGEVELAKVRIWGGCFLDEEFFGRHNRVAQLEFKYPDFTSEKFEIDDSMTAQWLTLAEPKKVDKVKIYLRRVHEGNTWNDTAISQIQFFDAAGATEWIEGLSATASSEYEDENHEYGPAKAVDGWLDTHWVDGDGTGEGEWLDVDLGGSRNLKRFAIATGFPDTDSLFQAYSRTAKVVLTFSDGSSQTIEVEDRKGLQTFEISPVSARSVKVTVKKIHKGKTHEDLYIGELRFGE